MKNADEKKDAVEPQVTPDQTGPKITLELNTQEAQVIVNLLAKLPIEQGLGLFNNVMAQVQPQLATNQ